MDTERSWADLTPDEKLRQRFQIYTSPRLPFVSAEAEAEYKARATRLRDAILLEKRRTAYRYALSTSSIQPTRQGTALTTSCMTRRKPPRPG